MQEVAKLEADAETDARGFWDGYGPRRIINTIEKLSALAQRLHRHNREQAYKAAMAEKPKLGTGKRFHNLEKSLSAKGASDPSFRPAARKVTAMAKSSSSMLMLPGKVAISP